MNLLTPLALLVAALATSARADLPATRPAEAPAVLVLPFARLSPSTDDAWIGPAVQGSLLSDLARSRAFTVHPDSATSAAVSDEAAAVRSARSAGARYVVVGSYQVVDHDVRFLGGLLDAESERRIGSLKSTGPLSELFALQDVMGRQLERQLSGALGTAAASEPAPLIEVRDPLRAGNAPVTFKGIEPSVAVDRNATEGTRRYYFGATSAYDGYYVRPSYFPRHAHPYFGRGYSPRGY
jgi:TolB-like protein